MASAERSALGFRVGGARMAVALEMITEVRRVPAMTRMPHAPPSLAGIANLRGAVTPIISLSRLFGHAQSADGETARVLVLDLEPPLGVIVDDVASLSRSAGVIRAGEIFVEGGVAIQLVDLLALLKTQFASLIRSRPGAGAGPPATTARPESAARDDIGLVTFELAGQLYALPLEQTREALRAAETLATPPGGDEADLGVIAWRDGVLPLVSLRALLGLPPGAGEDRRVLVVEIGRAAVGLVVDRLSAILRVSQTSLTAVPPVLNRGGGDAKIAALCRLAGGRGLVSILDPMKLFSDRATARIREIGRAQEHRQEDRMTQAARGGDRQAFVVFQLGQEEYGLPIAGVDEVLRLPDRLARLPGAPGFVEGVINLRGEIIPIIDQRRRFDAAGQGGAGARRVIITRFEGLKAGFIVDKVTEILSLSEDQLAMAPRLPGQEAPVFDRVAKIGDQGRMILLVDPKALLDKAEADMVKAMAQAANIAP